MSNPGDNLLEALAKDSRVKRFKELEAKIEKHPTIYKAYEDLKIAQQLYVRAKANASSKTEQLKEIYETQKKALLENPWVDEYLDLMESINHDIQWMIETIERSLNEELKDIE